HTANRQIENRDPAAGRSFSACQTLVIQWYPVLSEYHCTLAVSRGRAARHCVGRGVKSALAPLVHQHRLLPQVNLSTIVLIESIEKIANFETDASKAFLLPFADRIKLRHDLAYPPTEAGMVARKRLDARLQVGLHVGDFI